MLHMQLPLAILMLCRKQESIDVKKITTNALNKTASQTARVYYENATEAAKSRLTDEGIGILKSASINKMGEYKYFDNLSKAWKQTH